MQGLRSVEQHDFHSILTPPNSAVRFSRNAVTPSFKSPVSAMKPLASASAAAALSSPWRSRSSSLPPRWRAARAKRFFRPGFRFGKPLPVSTTRSTTPSASASGARRIRRRAPCDDHLRAEAAHRALCARPARHHADRGFRGNRFSPALPPRGSRRQPPFQTAAERVAGHTAIVGCRSRASRSKTRWP